MKDDFGFIPDEDTTQDEFGFVADGSEASAPEQEEISQLEAGIRGAAQGLLLEHADELAGAGLAAKETLFGDAKLADLLDTYQRERDIQREKMQAAQEQHPGTYMASDVAGSIASMAIPGLGLARGAKAAAGAGKAASSLLGAGKLAKAAKAAAPLAAVGAVEGGVVGAGMSEAELLEGDVAGLAKDIGTMGGVGAVTGAVAPAITKLLSGAAKAPTYLAKKAVTSTSDIGEEAADFIYKNPELVGDAKVFDETLDKVETAASDLLNDAYKKSNAAVKLLDSTKNLPIGNITDRLNREIFATSADSKGALAGVKLMLKQRAGKQGYLSQKDLREVLQEIKQSAKFNSSARNLFNEAHGIINKSLKESPGIDPEYIKLMEGASEQIGKAKQFSKFFNAEELYEKIDDVIESNFYNITGDVVQKVKDVKSVIKVKTGKKEAARNKILKLAQDRDIDVTEILQPLGDDVVKGARATAIDEMISQPQKLGAGAQMGLARAGLSGMGAGLGYAASGGDPAGALVGAGLGLYSRPLSMGALRTLGKASKAKSKVAESIKKKIPKGVEPSAAMASGVRQQVVKQNESVIQDKSPEELQEMLDLVRGKHPQVERQITKAMEAPTESERKRQVINLQQQPGIRELMRRLKREE